MNPHPGIRINAIPAEGAGGLIFALGITAIFLIGFPAFLPFVAGSALAGLALAVLLHRRYYT